MTVAEWVSNVEEFTLSVLFLWDTFIDCGHPTTDAEYTSEVVLARRTEQSPTILAKSFWYGKVHANGEVYDSTPGIDGFEVFKHLHFFLLAYCSARKLQ